ncbi:MAG: oligosaccharide flippase family protein [Chloroflexota bacterium]
MKRLSRYKADVLIVAGFLILPLLLFSDVTLGGHTMVPADNLFQWLPWASDAAALGVGLPHNSLLSDLILENYVWKQFIRESLSAGELPLWSPYLFAGSPFLATGQSAAYYPFSVFFLVLPLAKAYGWYTISQLWLAGVFTYLFARVMRMRRPSAAMAGLVFQGAGFMLVSAAVFPMIVGAAIWLPLLLASLEMAIRAGSSPRGAGRTLPWVALGALALGSQILAGHIEITYYTLLVMAGYAGWRLVSRGVYLAGEQRAGNGADYFGRRLRLRLLKTSVWLLGLVTIGIMLGAIQFVPFYEVGQANFREGSASLAEVRGWAFPPRRALTLAAPNFFGNPAHHSYQDVFSGERVPLDTNYYGEPNPNGAGTSSWGIKNYVEGGVYLGILPLLLAFLGLWTWRRRSSGPRSAIFFFVVLSFFSLAFIFGTPLYAILYYGLPGINQLHSPFRWVFPLSLAVAMLAGYGMDYLAASRQAATNKPVQAGRWASDTAPARLLQPLVLWGRPSLVTWLAGALFWGGVLLLGGLGVSYLFYGSLEPLIERVFLGMAKAPEAFPHARAFYSYELRQFLILALALIASGAVLRVSRCPIFLPGGSRSQVRRPLWPILALIVVGLDLLVANAGFHTAADPALLEYRPDLVAWLQEQPGRWRMTTFTPRGDKPLNANTPWLYGLQDVRGYDSVIPRQYVAYMEAIEPQNELLFNRIQPIVNWESLNSPLLDLLGVKYIVSAETVDLPKLEQVWEGEGLRVYENLAVAPRAFTLPQTATAVVPDPLAEMLERDPRQHVIVAQEDWRTLEADWEMQHPPLIPNIDAPLPDQPLAAEVTAYGNIEVVVQTAVEDPSWLVLTDSYFEGWKAFVRPQGTGEDFEDEVPLYRVNGNFRGVLLEPGEWSVRFRYSPLTFKVGGLTSAMAGIILLFAFGVWGWRRFYNPQVEMSNTRSIAKNSLVPTLLNLLNRSIDFLFAAFYLRVLGPADAGSYANAIAVAGWFEIISNFGLNTLIIRDVSQDKSRASHYLLNTIVLRLGTSAVAALPIVLYLWLGTLGQNPLGPEAIAAILLLMAGMLFSGAAQSFTGLFYAYETAETPAAIATITTILKVGFGVLALLLGYGFVGLAAVSILVNLVTLGILGLSAFRSFALRGPWRLDLGLQRKMVSLSYPLMLNHLLATVFFFVDVPLMREINGEEAVGWYNSAYKWVNAINVIPSFFTFALFPVISRQIANDLESARRTFRMSIKLMTLIALPIAAVTTLLGPLLIGILGGPEFLPEGGLALQLVIWSIPVGWINSVTNYVLIALGQERVQVRAFMVAVAVNVVANLLFLPQFSFRAAAVTTIVSEIVLLAIFNIYLRQSMPAVGWQRLLWRPLAITAFMGAAMWAGAQVHLAAGLAAGALVYPLGLWLLRVFGEEERQILQSLLPAPLAARLKLV